MHKRHLLALLAILALCGCGRSGVTKLFPVRSNGYYGYIDRSGKLVIPYRYSKAGCFEGGLAIVATTGNDRHWGYIDNDGNYAIKPIYAYATAFSEGLAFVVPDGDAPQAIDKNGVVKFRLKDAQSAENFSEGLAAYSVLHRDGETWGFVNKDGKTAILPQFSAVSYFSGGMCGVMNKHGKWGYIDNKGDLVIDYIYDNVFPFNNGRAKVSLYGKWGVIDKENHLLLQPRYEDLDLDGDGTLVKENKKWGWLGTAGLEAIKIQFNDAYPFHNSDFAAVKTGQKWGFINKDGKFVIAPQYDFAFGFDGGLALVETDGKYGFINEEGKYVIGPEYDHLPVDYFIRNFAHTSAFYSVKTDIDDPKNVAYKWLTGFYHMDYNEARKYASDDTRKLIDQFSSISDMISDSSRQRMAGLMVSIVNCEEHGNRAIVNYTLSDNRGREQMLFLVKADDKWRVQFTKNDELPPTLPQEASGGQ